jgi:hypothetical protein
LDADLSDFTKSRFVFQAQILFAEKVFKAASVDTKEFPTPAIST